MKVFKSLFREGIRYILKKNGYEMFYQGHNPDLADDRVNDFARKMHLKYILNYMNINLVLDVGANQGQYASELRSLGYDGHIISFEPVSETYSLLEQTARGDSKWKTYKIGLGAENKTTEINVFPLSVMNSMLSEDAHNMRDLFIQNSVSEEACKSSGKESIELRRLDDIFGQITEYLGDECRLFIKLDTQGFDLEVLKGGQLTFQESLAIQSEISFIPIYVCMPNYKESIQAFESAGFGITGLFWVSRYNDLAASEFDCFMSKRYR